MVDTNDMTKMVDIDMLSQCNFNVVLVELERAPKEEI